VLCVGAGFGAVVTRLGVTVVVRLCTVACGLVRELDGLRTRDFRVVARCFAATDGVAFGVAMAAGAAAAAAAAAAAELATPLPATRLTMAPAPTSDPTPATAVMTRTLRRARSRPSMLRRRWGVMSPVSALRR